VPSYGLHTNRSSVKVGLHLHGNSDPVKAGMSALEVWLHFSENLAVTTTFLTTFPFSTFFDEIWQTTRYGGPLTGDILVGDNKRNEGMGGLFF
jgi:hypothetical protein